MIVTVGHQTPRPRSGADGPAVSAALDAGSVQAVGEVEEISELEVLLPTFEVRARFAESAADAEQAERQLRDELSRASEPFHELTARRHEDDGTWLVEARFVVVSVDAHTAVVGVHDALVTAGLAPDEVWSPRQLG